MEGLLYHGPEQNAEWHELLEYVLKAHLTLRAENLILGKITSLRELASLDLRSLLAFRNCGRKTAREIMTLIQRLRQSDPSLIPVPTEPETLSSLRSKIQNNEPVSEEKLKSALALAPSKDSLNLLPFFLDKRLPFLSENDLHTGFKANTPLTDIFLSVRTSKTLKTIGCNRLGQVLLTPSSRFLKQRNFGLKSLRELYSVVEDFVLNDPNRSSACQLDYSSFSDMLRSLITQTRINERNQEIMLMWLLPVENTLVTYRAIADKYSLSRGRIGQIINKGFRILRKPGYAKKLKLFWNKAVELVDSERRTITLEALAKGIAREFQWETSPHPAALKRLIRKCGPEELIERLGIPETKGNQPPLISYL
ncbi:MAG: DNA-directed RNA polymerase subunit alpha C-terminal domain-containing protein [Desulfatiglandaceae bacterium]